MRQIEDQWRINAFNPPNYYEVIDKIMSDFKYTYSNQADLNNYKNKTFKNYMFKKCSNLCLNSKNADFRECLKGCEQKVLASENLFSTIKKDYEDQYETYRAAGREFFLN